MTDQFLQHSIDITKSLSKSEKKEHGIFLTPRNIRQKQIERTIYWISLLKIKPKLILEPSCGSLEFLTDLDSCYKNINFIAVEKNEKVFNHISNVELIHNNKLTLINDDFLHTKFVNVDIVIGNPPYFVINNKDVPLDYRGYICGRPNIYCIFILHALQSLHEKKGGILSFVIPKSILNSVYYEGVRKMIIENYNLLEIIDYKKDDVFMDTDQETIGIIITNKKNITSSITYSLKTPSGVLFSMNSSELETLYQNSTTLKELGLAVKTGTIVWNQVKDRLTSDQSKTLLLYNSNIVNNTVILKNFKNNEKKQYIDVEKTEQKPFIVVNRGRGNAEFNMSYSKIDDSNITGNILVENHLNIIYNVSNTDPQILDKIITSFQDERTNRFLSLFAGNNALSKTELETILPIYIM
jgi:adenine-specific DNA-methyltransferase